MGSTSEASSPKLRIYITQTALAVGFLAACVTAGLWVYRLCVGWPPALEPCKIRYLVTPTFATLRRNGRSRRFDCIFTIVNGPPRLRDLPSHPRLLVPPFSPLCRRCHRPDSTMKTNNLTFFRLEKKTSTSRSKGPQMESQSHPKSIKNRGKTSSRLGLRKMMQHVMKILPI